jgi:hypothetical protein
MLMDHIFLRIFNSNQMYLLYLEHTYSNKDKDSKVLNILNLKYL